MPPSRRSRRRSRPAPRRRARRSRGSGRRPRRRPPRSARISVDVWRAPAAASSVRVADALDRERDAGRQRRGDLDLADPVDRALAAQAGVGLLLEGGRLDDHVGEDARVDPLDHRPGPAPGGGDPALDLRLGCRVLGLRCDRPGRPRRRVGRLHRRIAGGLAGRGEPAPSPAPGSRGSCASRRPRRRPWPRRRPRPGDLRGLLFASLARISRTSRYQTPPCPLRQARSIEDDAERQGAMTMISPIR